MKIYDLPLSDDMLCVKLLAGFRRWNFKELHASPSKQDIVSMLVYRRLSSRSGRLIFMKNI